MAGVGPERRRATARRTSLCGALLSTAAVGACGAQRVRPSTVTPRSAVSVVQSAQRPAPAPAPAILTTTPSERPPSILLAVGGDVSFGRRCGQRLLAEPEYDPFHGVARAWADADLRFVNLESGLSEQHGETQSPQHVLVFTGPPAGADALLHAGVGVVSTANNHAWDYAQRGLLETLENLERVGVAHAGTGRAEEDAYRPAILNVNGLSIAFFAVTQVWNLGVFGEEEARHYVAWADFPRLSAALRQARAEHDFVVLSYHGGEEYIDAPLTRTRAFVDDVMSLGVDLVIGHHPHVPQGIGWYGARPVFYSLGNLVFDGRQELPWTRASFIAKVRLRRGEPAQVVACPYTIDGFEPIALPNGEDARERDFEHHLHAISATVGGTDLGERDALGCVRLLPPARSTPATATERRLRDPFPADPGSETLGLR